MSAETLILIAGAILSLAFSYIPGLAPAYDKLEPTQKRLIMLLLLIVTTGSVYGLSCVGWGSQWGINITCNLAGFQGLIAQLILAIMANQGMYLISPRK